MDRSVRSAAEEIAKQLVAWRRYLHAHPELSFQEAQTAAYVAEQLHALGYETQQRIGGTFGLTATLRIDDRPATALRADMDALPITEQTELAFASQQAGIMHACGHDAHTSMLLGAAKLLAERRGALKRSVKLIFQPAEEQFPGGAAPMIRAGVLDDVQAVFGLHIWSEMPLGTLGTRVGPFMACASDLRIAVRGRGGHAAMPQQCVDPVVAAAQIILALQTVTSRSLAMTDSAVVSVTMVNAGTANNVIPEQVTLQGTVRTLSDAVFNTVARRIEDLTHHTAAAYGATAEVQVSPGYPVLVNHGASVEQALAAARRVGISGDEVLTLPPQGGGEDFAYYAQQRPAAFMFLGARNDAKGCRYPHHHPRFNIDEDALPLGAALLAQIALDAR